MSQEKETKLRVSRKFYSAVDLVLEVKIKLIDKQTEFSKEQLKLIWEEYLVRKCFWNLTLPADCGGIDLGNGLILQKPNKPDDEVFYTLEKLDFFLKEVAWNHGFIYRSLFASEPSQRVQLANVLLERTAV